MIIHLLCLEVVTRLYEFILVGNRKDKYLERSDQEDFFGLWILSLVGFFMAFY